MLAAFEQVNENFAKLFTHSFEHRRYRRLFHEF